MKQHPLANRSLLLSLSAMGALFLSIASFVLFFRITMSFFLVLMLVFFVASLVLAILTFRLAAKGKRAILANPEQFTGKNECNAAKIIGIISIIFDFVFVIFVILAVWVISHAFH